MKFDQNYIEKIILKQKDNFEVLALEIFYHQAKSNIVYKNYIQALNIIPDHIKSIEKIPFLPIDFFKTHSIKTGEYEPEIIFSSSGTTGQSTSKHYLKATADYEKTFTESFKSVYGNPDEYCVLALLPSYLERDGSSLVYMVEKLIKESSDHDSGFFLYNHEELSKLLSKKEKEQKKTILIGVTFALLDFAENFPQPLKHTIIMETGGMKGRRKEITRPEVHEILRKAFDTSSIHSEYGMTELMSQAYSTGGESFVCPTWMSILVRETDDPFAVSKHGKGAFNIIDLANLNSCAFIATSDLGIVYEDGSFNVQGRMDHSDIRGCNLMIL